MKFSTPKLKVLKKLNLKNKKSTLINENISLNINKNIRTSIKDDFKNSLIEKQKLKFTFGLTEITLKNYIKQIKKQKFFNNISLLELLSSRLDFIIYYLGFANTITQARQFINHGHILLNNRIINMPNTLCKINDYISIKYNSKIINLIKINIKNSKKDLNFNLNLNNLTIKFIQPIDIENLLIKFNESKIIEYYFNK